MAGAIDSETGVRTVLGQCANPHLKQDDLSVSSTEYLGTDWSTRQICSRILERDLEGPCPLAWQNYRVPFLGQE
jgi:hypothetical protein